METNLSDHDSIVFNSLNTWWSYQLTFETYFREHYSEKKTVWINLAHKNKFKTEVNASDFLNPLLYRNQKKNLINFQKTYNVSMVSYFLELIEANSHVSFASHDELRSYKIDNFEIGKLIYAQMCGKLQSIEFIFSKKNIKLMNYYLNLGKSAYIYAQEKIKKYKPKKIFVINDRFITSAAAISAAKLSDTEVIVIYWGSDPNRIIFYQNSLYDFQLWQDNILKNWKLLQRTISKSEISRIKNKFQETHSRVSKDSKTFLSYAEKGKALEISGSKVAIFYTSSEWEFSGTMQKNIDKKFYQNQYDGFFRVAEYLSKHDWEIVVKLHPQRKKNKFSVNLIARDERFNKIKNLMILDEKTKYDTYSLIKQATLNIVWASSVGLECIARGLPVMIAGDTPWCLPGVKNSVKNDEQLEKFIATGDFIYPVEELTPYLVYIKSFGEKFKYISLKRYIPMFENFEIIKLRYFYRVLSSSYYWLRQ